MMAAHIPHDLFCDLNQAQGRVSVAGGSDGGGGPERHVSGHTCSGNFPTLVPPNFWTTHPLEQVFTTDFMMASPIESS